MQTPVCPCAIWTRRRSGRPHRTAARSTRRSPWVPRRTCRRRRPTANPSVITLPPVIVHGSDAKPTPPKQTAQAAPIAQPKPRSTPSLDVLAADIARRAGRIDDAIRLADLAENAGPIRTPRWTRCSSRCLLRGGPVARAPRNARRAESRRLVALSRAGERRPEGPSHTASSDGGKTRARRRMAVRDSPTEGSARRQDREFLRSVDDFCASARFRGALQGRARGREKQLGRACRRTRDEARSVVLPRRARSGARSDEAASPRRPASETRRLARDRHRFERCVIREQLDIVIVQCRHALGPRVIGKENVARVVDPYVLWFERRAGLIGQLQHAVHIREPRTIHGV